MPSADVRTAPAAAAEGGVVRRLLDPAFGLFVWMAHLIVIYVANAVICGLQVTSQLPGAERGLTLALAATTLLAAAAVAVHGWRRYGQFPETPDQQFLRAMTVGQDALAIPAILWQLVPIFMSPVCR